MRFSILGHRGTAIGGPYDAQRNRRWAQDGYSYQSRWCSWPDLKDQIRRSCGSFSRDIKNGHERLVQSEKATLCMDWGPLYDISRADLHRDLRRKIGNRFSSSVPQQDSGMWVICFDMTSDPEWIINLLSEAIAAVCDIVHDRQCQTRPQDEEEEQEEDLDIDA